MNVFHIIDTYIYITILSLMLFVSCTSNVAINIDEYEKLSITTNSTYSPMLINYSTDILSMFGNAQNTLFNTTEIETYFAPWPITITNITLPDTQTIALTFQASSVQNIFPQNITLSHNVLSFSDTARGRQLRITLNRETIAQLLTFIPVSNQQILAYLLPELTTSTREYYEQITWAFADYGASDAIIEQTLRKSIITVAFHFPRLIKTYSGNGNLSNDKRTFIINLSVMDTLTLTRPQHYTIIF